MLLTHLNKFIYYLSKGVKRDLHLIERDYKKVMRVIRSCKCEEHLAVANRLITCFYMKHNNDFLLKRLEKRYRFKKKILSKA